MEKKRRTVRIEDLQPDPENRRKHTARNIGLLVESLQRVGAARSIVIDERGTVLAGNGVVEAAAEAGITKVQIIDADGDTVVAVRRRGLTDEQKRQLAIADNRVGEFSQWDPEQLAADRQAGVSLEPWFTEKELTKVIGAEGREAVVKEVQTGEVADRFWISVRGPLKHQAVALQRLRELLAELQGVEVEIGTILPAEEWR